MSAAEAEDHAAKAIEALTRATGMGYRNAHAWRSESVLNPLRSRDDFRFLMMDAAFPADAFALTNVMNVFGSCRGLRSDARNGTFHTSIHPSVVVT